MNTMLNLYSRLREQFDPAVTRGPKVRVRSSGLLQQRFKFTLPRPSRRLV